MSEHQTGDGSRTTATGAAKTNQQQQHDETSPLIAQNYASSSSSKDDSRTKTVTILQGTSMQSINGTKSKNSSSAGNFVLPSNYNLPSALKVSTSTYSTTRGLGIDSMDLTPKIKNISMRQSDHDDDNDDQMIRPTRTKSNSHIDILQPDIEPQRYSSNLPHHVYSNTTRSMNSTRSTKKNVPRSILSHLSYMITDESSLSDDGKSPRYYSDGQDGFAHSGKHGFKVHRPKKGLKRGILLLTVAFIIGTVAHRNYTPSDDLDDEDEPRKHDEIISVDAVHGKVCEERFMTNHEAIMALEYTSTVNDIPHGAVSTDDVRCSELAVSVMEDLHGNAMDAAVAATLCLGLVNPASSGIGGGAFILVHSKPRREFIENRQKIPAFTDRRQNRDDSSRDKSKKWTEVIDCRESAPGNATFDMYEDLPINASTIGALSIAVPGELRGLELAHARFGSLRWSDVVQPVIELAERGVYTSRILAKEILESKDKWQQFETINRIFTRNNDGRTYLQVGDIMRRPSYVETLKNVALNGADYIYKGEVAAEIAKEIQTAGGIITAQDIESYKPILRDALVSNVDGTSIVSVPPPSSGGATIIGALRFLSGYKNPYASFAHTLSVHRLVEALKHVFAIRMSMSDPDFFPNVTASAVQDLITGTFMEKLRKKTLDDNVLALSEYGGKWALINCTDDKGQPQDAHEGDRRLRTDSRRIIIDNGNHLQRRTRLFNYLEDHGTTHLNVVDKDRNSVSVTSSVNYYFGSNFASPSTGIIFNDVMDDFSTPGRPNTYGKCVATSNKSSTSYPHTYRYLSRFTSCRE
mmetsp:Transcript_460/g.783  ORF Transcript_460/g.783 Transcript_460/m.783 type:complete len:808 (+) Transcript_460:229-2652(+)